jgi:flagellar biosynthesis regulator FlaF
MAYLKLEDRIQLDTDSIGKAMKDDGPTLNQISCIYFARKDYCVIMTWCQLSANQLDTDA